MNVNYETETQESWLGEWQQEQLDKIIEETRQHIESRMLGYNPDKETKEEKDEKWT